MTARCDAKAALTGCCDARVALIGCQGEETHASSAAWSYGTDLNGTSAGARRKQKARGGGEVRHRGESVKEKGAEG